MTAFVAWLQHDTAGLLTLAAVSVAVLLLLIIKFKLEPFIALIVVGLLVGLAAGLLGHRTGRHAAQGDATPSWRRVSAASSATSRSIIGLGTVLGAILERSGGADVLTSRLLRLFGEKGAPARDGPAPA